MHRDQYGLEVTAASDAAADLSRQAVDAVLAAQRAAAPLPEQLLSAESALVCPETRKKPGDRLRTVLRQPAVSLGEAPKKERAQR
jgi:hypothetical protein